MRKIILLLLAIVGMHAMASAQTTLRFRADGTFKVLQFSDIHWDEKNKEMCRKNAMNMAAVLSREQPDLVVLNGDIVTQHPAKEGWASIMRIMEDSKVDFVVNMGNHDPEVAQRSEIYSWLSASKYYQGITAVDSKGNMDTQLLPIYSSKSDDRIAALIYCLDSGDYSSDQMISHYAWIKFHQIAWYRAESEKYTKLNGGTPLPALMFFHIPTPEFVEVQNDPKTFKPSPSKEGVASSAVNSGIFASVLEMKDVMCITSGHDHDNDFIGQNRGVALSYGRVGGYGAYGDLERGARVFRLYEGARSFDSWIATADKEGGLYYYPSGINSVEEDSMTYLPPFQSTVREHGVSYTYYEGQFKNTADIASGKVIKRGKIPYFSIQEANQKDHFAFEFRAIIRIPQRGVYQFYTYSDDGSVLIIDNQVVVDNDGGHSARRRTGKVALEAGLHELQLLYFEDYMGESLEVGVSARHLPEQPLPAEWLFVQ